MKLGIILGKGYMKLVQPQIKTIPRDKIWKKLINEVNNKVRDEVYSKVRIDVHNIIFGRIRVEIMCKIHKGEST